MKWFVENGESDEGATAVEYAIIASLVAGVIIAVVAIMGVQVGDFFNTVAGAF